METCRIFVPFGAVGIGITDEAFERGIEMHPDIISADAGSTDSGPYYLGTGKCKYARESVKSDLRRMIVAGAKLNIPVTVGSVGTCGLDSSVDWMADIVTEIANEEGLTPKVAKIYTEQSSEKIANFFKEGKLLPLLGAPEIDAEKIRTCEHIVGLAGVEPFIEALEHGADVVICGRSTDTAIIAAYPIMKGFPAGLCWHAAKTTECGSFCTTNPWGGGVMITIDQDGFELESTSPNSEVTPYTASAHLLYENTDPISMTEPGVVFDTSKSKYTATGNGRVRVTGTTHEIKPYTIKLEGSRVAGYQTVELTGIRDRTVMRDPYKWLNAMDQATKKKLDSFGISRQDYSVSFNLYGYNATYGGPVPEGYIPNEIGVLCRVTARTQELATKVAKVYNPQLLHFPTDRKNQVPSFAFPFSPNELERGKIYEFVFYHVVPINDYHEMCRIVYDF